MQKYIILLICVFFLSFAFAQTADENFEKTGQAELAKAEGQLGNIKKRISVHLQEMVKDSVIVLSEMKELQTLVNEFHQTRQKSSQHLLFYGKETMEFLCGWEDEILDIYFGQLLLDLSHKDDPSGTIRKYFIEGTGYNITVSNGYNLYDRLMQGIVLGMALGIFLGWLMRNNGFIYKTCISTGVILFLIVLSAFLIL